ncbi:transketolase family protein [Haloglycomyces albus]|uniref:transketolase family protein n=1 Tax=Haloglycomyces albus TaxID=526067 RepID=UPI00046D3AF6|nr:hypothetical protein [Haloglycomyces albus]
MTQVITRAEMREQFMETTTELMDRYRHLSLVLAAIGSGPSELGPVLDRYPERAFNVGIREQLMMGMAAGTALEGLRPIVHSYTPFLIERAFEQIKLDFGHQGTNGILVSTGASYDWSQGGFTHYGQTDISLLSSIPDWTLHVPGHAEEVDAMLWSAGISSDSVYVRLSTRSNREAFPEAINGFQRFADGHQAVVVAVGPMLDNVLDAVEGLDVGVVYTPTPSALDRFPVHDYDHGVFIVVEPYLEGSSSARLTAALEHRMHRLLNIGVKNVDLHRYGTPEDHDRRHGLDPAGLRERIVDFLY